jgi:AbrB family looped-hinge helix DNA binding protein
MNTTTLSSKGQIIVPKQVRDAHNWQAGLTFIVIDTEDGLLFKPQRPFPPTTVDDVAGCLAYTGTPKTVEEMDTAVQQGIAEAWHGSS